MKKGPLNFEGAAIIAIQQVFYPLIVVIISVIDLLSLLLGTVRCAVIMAQQKRLQDKATKIRKVTNYAKDGWKTFVKYRKAYHQTVWGDEVPDLVIKVAEEERKKRQAEKEKNRNIHWMY